MTDPLNYETPAPVATGTQSAAWISLLVLGILYGLGAMCTGGSALFMFAVIFKGPAAPAPEVKNILLAVMIGMIAFLLACGITYLWTSFRVRRGSRPAAITSLILAILNAAGLIILVCLGLYGLLSERGAAEPAAWFGILFYAIPILANTWAAYILVRFLRQRKSAQVLG